jgi:Family of unknown function (DUF5675)
MLQLVLDRDIRTNNSTIGNLFVNGKFECVTLEDKDRGLKQSMSVDEIAKIKVKGQTAIPTGTYEVVITFSNRFQKDLPLLLYVKGFEAIRLHSGNTAADTEGCPLIGTTKSTDFIGQSRDAFGLLFLKIKAAILNKEKVFIEIKD